MGVCRAGVGSGSGAQDAQHGAQRYSTAFSSHPGRACSPHMWSKGEGSRGGFQRAHGWGQAVAEAAQMHHAPGMESSPLRARPRLTPCRRPLTPLRPKIVMSRLCGVLVGLCHADAGSTAHSYVSVGGFLLV